MTSPFVMINTSCLLFTMHSTTDTTWMVCAAKTKMQHAIRGSSAEVSIWFKGRGNRRQKNKVKSTAVLKFRNTVEAFLRVPLTMSLMKGTPSGLNPRPHSRESAYQSVRAQLVPEIRPRVSGVLIIITVKALQHASYWPCHILQ